MTHPVPMVRQPRGDMWSWRDVLPHRAEDDFDAAVARFERVNVPPAVVAGVLQDSGDELFSASRSGDDDWTLPYGGALAVALLAAEVSALTAHLNSRASSVRALAVNSLLDEYSAVSVAEELGVSRQKVYDIARTSQRTVAYIPHVPWRSHEHHD